MYEKQFTQFLELIVDQFKYGGKKYAHSGERESTDVLFDRHTKNWLFGTIDKYTFRYKNLARERDLLKIATYMYILWLKRGFFIMKSGINSPAIDTNVKNKIDNFPKFIDVVKRSYEYNRYIKGELDDFENSASNYTPEQLAGYYANLDKVSNILKEWSKSIWEEVSEMKVIAVIIRAFLIWNKDIKNKGTDKDTYNEKKDK